ncbi:MAG: SDR family oxidoreductase [Cyanobacteria bacterium J06642_2]
MYLVTGATGQLGRRIVRHLTERDCPARAFARLQADYRKLEHWGANICIGDLRNRDDIRRACRGARVIISAHGSGRDLDGAEALDYRANMHLVDAAQEFGIEHFVFISVLGSDRDYSDAPVFKAKAAVEKALLASSLNYTILRPSGFASNVLRLAQQFRTTGTYLLVGEGAHRTSIVSTDDLAKMAILAPNTEAAGRQIFEVGGPDVLRRDDIPQIFGRLFNREPFVIRAPLTGVDVARALLGFVDTELSRSLGTLRTLLAHEFYCTPAETARVREVFDLPLESLEHYLRRHLDLE